MSVYDGLFTSEAVSAGHPDKVCDRISDAILDEFLILDANSRVACETLICDGKVLIAGEFRTGDERHFAAVEERAEAIARQALREVGYRSAEFDINPGGCEVEVRFNHQAAEIAHGVDGGDELGAGDQGLMFGYACDETEALMPAAWSYATDLIARGSQLREQDGSPLRGDAKSQVTMRYVGGVPVGVQAVVLSWQHCPSLSAAQVRDFLQAEIIDAVIAEDFRTSDFHVLINPAGPWTVGGPKGDTGLTGRKIIVDSYGGACPHGGGAFSGKDPSKVDRSAAYAARWVAKSVVAAGLAKRATVQLAYAIGYSQPVSVHIHTHGTGRVPDGDLHQAVVETFDLSPGGIIQDLDLARPIYRATSSLGHFGRWRDASIHLWEGSGRVARLVEKGSGLASWTGPASS
jgi:S-adenosylmethionine synthetase